MRRLVPWLLIAGLIAIWEILVRLLNVPQFLLPAPSVIATRTMSAWPQIRADSLVTLIEIGGGFGLSVLIGIPVAVAIAHSRALEQSVYPLLVGAQVLPKIAIAPLLVVWFGFGLEPKLVIAFLVAFFPIVIDTVVGLTSVPQEMIHLSRSMGGRPWQILWRVELPYAAPNVFAGLKVAATLAVVGAIVGEFVASDKGLGNLLLIANGQLDIPLLFSAILALMVIGVVFFYALDWLEVTIVTWHVRRRPTAQLTQ